MKRWHRGMFLLLALLGVLAATPASSEGAVQQAAEEETLLAVEAGTVAELRYRPPANSDYAVCLFSAEGKAVTGEARLLRGGEVVAAGSGSGKLCSAWLVAGEEYLLRVNSDGAALVEIARDALSRCSDRPLELEENKVSGKMIARAGDAHWYAFHAEATGRMLLDCVPEQPGLVLQALLFDADEGALIARFESLSGGACMLLADTVQGKRYALRVSAPAGGTGYYELEAQRPDAASLGEVLRFSEGQTQNLAVGGTLELAPLLQGEALLWISEAPGVVSVSRTGTALGLTPGEALITAYGMSTRAQCRLRVEEVALEGLRVLNSRIELQVGETTEVELAFLPQNASDRRVRFAVDKEDVASVSGRGKVTGLQEGETALTVTDAAGNFTAQAKIRVVPAARRYRALLVGEQNYPFEADAERTGSENSLSALESLLRSDRFAQSRYEVHTARDLSRAELIAQLRECFSEATEGDLSLIYLTCHGNFTGGMSFLELSDGSEFSARDLERELRRIRGEVVLLLDCCGSGGTIGAASPRLAFARGITGAPAGASIRGSRYHVLCSAGLDEDSFRLAFNQQSEEGVMATVFMRALCDGAGWDIDRGVRGTLGADADYDGAISLAELAEYMQQRVTYYLDLASELTGERYRQSVYAGPQGDPLILLE